MFPKVYDLFWAVEWLSNAHTLEISLGELRAALVQIGRESRLRSGQYRITMFINVELTSRHYPGLADSNKRDRISEIRCIIVVTFF